MTDIVADVSRTISAFKASCQRHVDTVLEQCYT